MSVKARVQRLERRLIDRNERERPPGLSMTSHEWDAFIGALPAKIQEIWKMGRVGPENPEAASNMRRSKDLGERR